MKRLKALFILLFCFLLSNAALAQQGTIRGTVIDGSTGEPLPGVNVLVKGTTSGASTDIDGKFDIDLPGGSYDLRFSYISFQSLTITGIEVTSGKVTIIHNIRLKPQTTEMEEVVVTAEAVNVSEAALLTKKKKSPNLLDGISAEQFGRVGVSDAAEALKKVTGVSVEGGKYIYVRGLGDRYTNTTLNSVEIPSLDPNRNSIQIDIFPTQLIDNMVISKTSIASMPADFAGGVVNIETKDFPGRPIFDVSASIGYNPSMHFQSDFLTYTGSSTDFLGFDNGRRALPEGAGKAGIPTPLNDASDQQVYDFVNSFNPTLGPRQNTNLMDYSLGLSTGNQFDIGRDNKLGYIFSARYSRSSKYYDDYTFGEYQTQTAPDAYELIYATKQNGTVAESDVLVAGLAGIAFKTPHSKFKLTGMRLQQGENRVANFFVNNSQTAPGQSGYFAESYALEYSQSGITNVLLNGSHYFDDAKWQADWRLSSTFSNMEDPDIRRTTYTTDEDGSDPRFSAGAGGFPNRIWRYLDEVNFVARADIAREYQFFGEKASLIMGGSYIYKQRDYKILNYQMQPFGAWPELTGDPSEILQDSNIYPNGNIYYLSGNPDPNPNAYSSNVTNLAFYLSNEFTLFSRLKANIGLRAEQYVMRHTGRDALYAQGDMINGHNLDNDKVLDKLDLFPSANLTYYLTDNQNLRFSYSKTIARPSFKEMSYAQILDPVANRIFNGGLFPVGEWGGNLHQTHIQNFDLRWERYFKRDQLFSVSLFYKEFDDPIELVRLQNSPTTSEYQPRNVGDGKVYGAEFEVRKSLEFLSFALQRLAFNTNVTLVKSEITMTDQEYQARKSRQKMGQNIDRTRRMAGQAPYIINAGLTYDNPTIGIDGGLFYNVEGETVVVVGGGLYPDVYSQPFHSLKLNLNKSFGSFSASLNITNILSDSRCESFEAYKADKQPYSVYHPSTSVSVGLKYSFN